MVIYKCDKCGREADFDMIAGMPLYAVPCSDGTKCKGHLIIQQTIDYPAFCMRCLHRHDGERPPSKCATCQPKHFKLDKTFKEIPHTIS